MQATAPKPEEAFKLCVQKFYAARLLGCGRASCSNSYCVSNATVPRLPPAEAAAEALKLAFHAVENPVARFCTDHPAPYLATQRVMELVEAADPTPAVRELGRVLSDADAVALLFLREGAATPVTAQDSGTDVAALQRFYAVVESKAPLKNAVCNAFEALTASLRRLSATSSFFVGLKGLRLFEVVLAFPALLEPQHHRTIVAPLLDAVASLPDAAKASLVPWWAHMGLERMQTLLALLQQVITMRILLPPPLETVNADATIVNSVKTMAVLHSANREAGVVIPFKEFYNQTLNENLDVQDDFIRWEKKQGFSFCQTPFVLSPDTKAHVLFIESKVTQYRKREQNLRNLLFGGGPVDGSPYLVFAIRRDHLIPDTLENIVRVGNRADLQKELKIKFVGEDGIDAGGVQKEFFQLIVKEIFNPDFGMWTLDPETRNYYFSTTSQELREFELIGTILGLAIYNSVILDVHLPPAVYKKLMGLPVGLEDLKNVSPELWRGMKTLLAFPGNVEETYARDFQVETEYYGAKQYHELKPGGAAIALTNANREEYVQLFVDFQLNRGVAKQFEAFRKGFELVVNGPAFGLFSVEELELLICGDPALDFEALEAAAEYENEDFNETHEVVKWFWEVAHSLPEEQKRKLLHFATGSDRAPIGGLKNLRLVIQRHGDGDERLPSSHTCFNHLLLPRYSSKQALEAKLLLALTHAVGFGLQ